MVPDVEGSDIENAEHRPSSTGTQPGISAGVSSEEFAIFRTELRSSLSAVVTSEMQKIGVTLRESLKQQLRPLLGGCLGERQPPPLPLAEMPPVMPGLVPEPVDVPVTRMRPRELAREAPRNFLEMPPEMPGLVPEPVDVPVTRMRPRELAREAPQNFLSTLQTPVCSEVARFETADAGHSVESAASLRPTQLDTSPAETDCPSNVRKSTSGNRKAVDWSVEFCVTRAKTGFRDVAKQVSQKKSAEVAPFIEPLFSKQGISQGVDGHLRKDEDQHQRPSWCELLQMLIRSDLFDYVVCLLLILNAISIGVAVDWKARHGNDELPASLDKIEKAFCGAFSIELLLRMLATRSKFFAGPTKAWNLFDTVLVVMQMTEEISLAFWRSESSQANPGLMDVLKPLRILRLLRIVRIMRLVRFVSELRKLVYLIAASFWSFVWTIGLLAMLTYMVSVFVTQLVNDTIDDGHAKDPQLELHFGGILRSANSLYRAITGGQDWGAMYDVLAGDANHWSGMIFAAYVAFCCLVLLNLVTGVFVDGAMRLSKNDREMDLVKKIHKAFKLSDADGSGALSFEEFCSRIEHDEVKNLFAAIEMSVSMAEDLFRILDEDNSGQLTPEEFAGGSLKLLAPAKALDVCLMTHQMARGFENIRRCFGAILNTDMPIWASCEGVTGVAHRLSAFAAEEPSEAMGMIGSLGHRVKSNFSREKAGSVQSSEESPGRRPPSKSRRHGPHRARCRAVGVELAGSQGVVPDAG